METGIARMSRPEADNRVAALLEACIKAIVESLSKPAAQPPQGLSLSPIAAKVRMGSTSYRREVYRLSQNEGTCVLMGATRRCQLQSDGTWVVV
jgi:hypothetical protein